MCREHSLKMSSLHRIRTLCYFYMKNSTFSRSAFLKAGAAAAALADAE